MLKIKHMQETNREHCQREKFLRDEVSLKNCEMKELSENIWLLKKSLDGVQVAQTQSLEWPLKGACRFWVPWTPAEEIICWISVLLGRCF